MVNTVSKLEENVFNDLIIRTEDVKTKLVNDIDSNINFMVDNANVQITISSVVFGFSFLLFLIVAQRGVLKNFHFINAALVGKFSEDCKIQIDLLNQMQESIDAQGY